MSPARSKIARMREETGSGRHPRQQRRHPDVGLRRSSSSSTRAPTTGSTRCASTSARCCTSPTPTSAPMVDAGWGRIVTIVSDAGRKGERYPGDLRRGQGRRDGVHARARGRGRRARRHRELRRRSATMKTGPPKTRSRAIPISSAASPGRTPCPGSARPTSRPARRAVVQRRRRVDHRPGVPGRRRLRLGASDVLDSATAPADSGRADCPWPVGLVLRLWPWLLAGVKSACRVVKAGSRSAGLAGRGRVAAPGGVARGTARAARRPPHRRARDRPARRSASSPRSAIYSDLAGPFGRGLDAAPRPCSARAACSCPLALVVGAGCRPVPARRRGRRGPSRAGCGSALGIVPRAALAAVGLLAPRPRRLRSATRRARAGGRRVGAARRRAARAPLGRRARSSCWSRWACSACCSWSDSGSARSATASSRGAVASSAPPHGACSRLQPTRLRTADRRNAVGPLDLRRGRRRARRRLAGAGVPRAEVVGRRRGRGAKKKTKKRTKTTRSTKPRTRNTRKRKTRRRGVRGGRRGRGRRGRRRRRRRRSMTSSSRSTLPPGHRLSPWKLPPATVLKRSESSEVDPRLVAGGRRGPRGHDARVRRRRAPLGATVGPTVTRYELELAPGVKVNKVTSLAKEIAYSMASHDVRILAPIPGRSAIGVEVPEQDAADRDARRHPRQRRSQEGEASARGRDGPRHRGQRGDVEPRDVPARAHRGPDRRGQVELHQQHRHVVARCARRPIRFGSSSSTRSASSSVSTTRVPHLLTEVVTNPKKAANALDWAVREMEMRYDLLADVGVRDITGYNAMYDRGDLPTTDDPDPDTGKSYDRLPFIVVVVDELADLMMVAARDVETSICRLAQMARAVGIHLVIATQRPSVDVITGVIKANIPSRLAFSVSTLADSRVILDQTGAEKLIGKGDMLMLTASSSRTERIQGAWVDEECVRKVVAHWRRQTDRADTTSKASRATTAPGGGRDAHDDDDSDDLLDEAMELVVRSRPRLDEHAAAQAPRRFRPRRPTHGPPGTAGRRRALRGLEGPVGAHERRRARGDEHALVGVRSERADRDSGDLRGDARPRKRADFAYPAINVTSSSTLVAHVARLRRRRFRWHRPGLDRWRRVRLRRGEGHGARCRRTCGVRACRSGGVPGSDWVAHRPLPGRQA